MPHLPGFVGDLKRFGVDVIDRKPIPTADAQRIAIEQRALRGLLPGHPETTAVGGFRQHTVLTKYGVHTQIAHRWPDVIGERIEAA